MVYAFIDSQNLNLGIQSLGWRLNFKKFYILLKHKFRVDKAYIFLGYIPKYKKLYAILRSFGYEMIFKPTVIDKNGSYKGNVDVEIVIQALWKDYDNYDKAVFVSGDGDFYSLYKALESKKKLGKIIIPNYKSASNLLGKFNDHIYLLERDKKSLKK